MKHNVSAVAFWWRKYHKVCNEPNVLNLLLPSLMRIKIILGITPNLIIILFMTDYEELR